jgi:hypothetical protein
LAAAALLLNTLVDAQTGTYTGPANARDLQPLVRSAIDCLSAASGTSPAGTDPNGSLHKVLDVAPADVRQIVLTAWWAFAEWQEATQGRH